MYFSGHGVLREEGGQLRRYLVFSDTMLSAVRTTGMSVLSLDDRVSRADATTRVVVQDTCFAATPGGKSLGLPADGEGRKGLALPEPRLALQPGDVRLYASQFFEIAMESPELRASLYTHHLLEALTTPEADLDGDGCVDLREGHGWARDRTSKARDGLQTPQGHFVDTGDLTLGCVPSDPVRGVFQRLDREDWTVEIRARAGGVVQRGGGALPAGRYRVEVGRLEDTGTGSIAHHTLMDTTLRLKAGAWVDLPEVVAERRAPIRTLGIDAGWRGAGSLPAMGAGVSGWYAMPQRRFGRTVVGIRSHLGAGPIPDYPGDLIAEHRGAGPVGAEPHRSPGHQPAAAGTGRGPGVCHPVLPAPRRSSGGASLHPGHPWPDRPAQPVDRGRHRRGFPRRWRTRSSGPVRRHRGEADASRWGWTNAIVGGWSGWDALVSLLCPHQHWVCAAR